MYLWAYKLCLNSGVIGPTGLGCLACQLYWKPVTAQSPQSIS